MFHVKHFKIEWEEYIDMNNKLKSIAAVCAAAICLSSCGNIGGEQKAKQLTQYSTYKTGVTTTTVTGEKAALVITGAVTTIKTTASCNKITFDNGAVLFANAQGTYTIINSNNEELSTLDITDDNGEVLTITNKNYHITLSKNGKEVNSFSYKGTRIIIKDNEVFYAGTKVEYFDQSFHSFNVTENISIECISQGKFEIRKNGKKIAKAKVKDINGAEYELEAVEKGMEITNSNNELMESIVVGTNYISVSGDKVIINGKTMEAPHSADIVPAQTTTTTVSTTTKATTKKTTSETTTTAKKETEPQTTTTTTEAYIPEPEQPSEPDSSTNMMNRNISAETSELLGYVNEVRRQYGLNELSGLELLDSAAAVRAGEIAQEYSHNRPDGTGYDTVFEEVGLPEWYSVAENIATGMNCMTGVKEVFDQWMQSEGHRENILNPNVRYMAVAKNSYMDGENEMIYWDQLFYSDV